MHTTSLLKVGGSVMLAVPPPLLDPLELRAGAAPGRAARQRGETTLPVEAKNAVRRLRATTVTSARQVRGSPKPPAASVTSLVPSHQGDQKLFLKFALRKWSIPLPDGSLATCVGDLVAKSGTTAESASRQPTSPAELRRLRTPTGTWHVRTHDPDPTSQPHEGAAFMPSTMIVRAPAPTRLLSSSTVFTQVGTFSG